MSGKTSGHDHRTAPGALAVVHAFLNTWHADGPRERFDSPARLQDWLAKRGLIAPATPVSATDFDAVCRLRAGLRVLLGSAGRRAADPMELNRLIRKARLTVQFDAAGQPHLAPDGVGVQAALARILAAIAVGQTEGTWSRLKLCRNGECQRIFYDASKNRSAVWCSSQLCGNRMNARAYRARKERRPVAS